MKKALQICGVIALFLAGYWLGCEWPVIGQKKPVIAQIDTLILRDTITSEKPVYIERVKLDSVRIPVTDSVRVHDTLYVYLERERIEWTDSLCTVYASGIMPNVDSVRHYTQTTIITKEIPVKVSKRWGIGIQAGAGLSSAGIVPYVGVGISYNLLSF